MIKAETNQFVVAMKEARRIGREGERIAEEVEFDPDIPLDPYNDDAVAQVIGLGLAGSVEEARYLLKVCQMHWQHISTHLRMAPVYDDVENL